MSKPDDIPQDVWAEASIHEMDEGLRSFGKPSVILACARAIMAERERCAAKADARVISERLLQALDSYACGASDTARAIADEIRSTP